MNPPNAPSEPNEPEGSDTPVDPFDAPTVDELLSADLDGEFDAAAADLGLAPAVARARLGATPGSDARRRALAAARTVSATPVAPIPADRREALLSSARSAPVGTDELARRRRPLAGRIAGVVAAAAAVLLVIGLAVSIASSGSDHGDNSSASGATATDSASESTVAGAQDERATEGLASVPPAATAAGPTWDFGAVPDEATLQARITDGLARAASRDNEVPQAGEDAAGARTGVSDECLAAQAESFGLTAVPILRGTVEYQGTPAEVLVFARGDDASALTVATADCRVLVSVFVHP